MKNKHKLRNGKDQSMMYKSKLSLKKKMSMVLGALLFIALIFVGAGCVNQNEGEDDATQSEDIIISSDLDLPGDSTENIMQESSPLSEMVDVEVDDKMVTMSMDTVGRANPFMPSKGRNIGADTIGYDLMEPPTTTPDESAQKIISTKISGIMYDKNSPSAILNIDSSDYLVRSGDVIDGYKVLAISPSTVTLQLGSNIYKAGVGQVVDGGEVNYNKVSNLSNKFGGSKR